MAEKKAKGESAIAVAAFWVLLASYCYYKYYYVLSTLSPGDRAAYYERQEIVSQGVDSYIGR
jgi:hypothetical protein